MTRKESDPKPKYRAETLTKQKKSSMKIGMQFGHWTVIDENPVGERTQCKCVCGNIDTPMNGALRAGRSKSCGCRWKEAKAETKLVKYGVECEIGHNKKYHPEIINKALNDWGVIMTGGDINDSRSVATFTWEDGATKTTRIARFMQEGCVKPKVPGPARLAKERIDAIGLSVTPTDGGLSIIRYKDVEWTQSWVCLDQRVLDKLKKIDRGVIIEEFEAQGMSLNQACKSIGADSNSYYRARKFGIRPREVSVALNSFEKRINLPGAEYNRNFESHKIRPDIKIREHKLIIETDGMVYHWDKPREPDRAAFDKKHHFKRWDIFHSEGYKILAFSEKEVIEKRDIVDSMIGHKMGESKKIGASKTKIKKVPNNEAREFFERCHLKGSGSGETLGLYFKGDLICALRYKKDTDAIHISRFCCELNTSVMGGYSKLLNQLPKEANIVNFVDRRHGDGEHLLSKGFVKVSTHIGFEWTNGYDNYNRRKFLGNSGYENGMFKFYDYGQIKYVRPKQ